MVKKTVLDNGLTIVVDTINTAKSVAISYFVNAGSYDEKDYPAGISHFIEHMLFKGTKNRSAREINKSIDSVGGIMNAYTDYLMTKYYCIMPFDQWKLGLDVFSDLIWNHTIPEDELERERTVILEEIKMYNDDPQSVAYDFLHKEMHKGYDARQSIIGTSESVKSITKEDILNYVSEFYQPNNITLVVSGNIEESEVVDFIKNYEITRNGKTTKDVVDLFKPNILSSETKTLSREIEQAHLTWGLFVPGSSSKESFTAEVIANLMGGSMSSRLYQIIREERGLCYTLSVSYYDLIDSGMIVGYVGLDKSKIEEVKDVVIEEFEKLRVELLDETELKETINNNNGQMLIRTESTSSINDFVGRQIISGLNPDLEDYLDNIKQVGQQDVKDFSNKYFTPDNWQFIEVVPK